MKKIPEEFHSLPFHEYIQDYTPVNAISKDVERLLWHQRLGHPSDYYLLKMRISLSKRFPNSLQMQAPSSVNAPLAFVPSKPKMLLVPTLPEWQNDPTRASPLIFPFRNAHQECT